MDELVRFLRAQGGQGDQLGTWEVLFALALCLVCLLLICFVYRFTHKGASYSQSFVQTLVLAGLVTTVIMIVIGSNIARAFSLVGALSIIRFRNAVKETRDVGYIFFCMAVAMACGTRFYFVGLLSTFGISGVMVLMHVSNFGGSRIRPARLLKVQMPPGSDPEQLLGEVLRGLFEMYSVVTVETVRQGLYTEAVISVRAKAGVTPKDVLAGIAEANGNLKISYNVSSDTDDL